MGSSAIKGFWYDSHRQVLDVLFVSGRRYRYRGVPAETADAMTQAASHGGYFNEAIRGRFECEEIGRTRRWGDRLER